jgi:hypothetical protein
MATVRLGRYELEEYDLPRVCMRCGTRATTYKAKKFTWSPPWSYFVLGAFGAAVFAKSMTVRVPFCEKHKWHWTGRAAVVGFSLPVIALVFVAGVAVASQLNAGPEVVFLPTGVLFVAWLIMAAVLLGGAIRAGEITDKSVTLLGVSEEFVEALDEERRGGDEDEDDRPRRRRADDGAYYDPRARRRRRGRDDDEDER